MLGHPGDGTARPESSYPSPSLSDMTVEVSALPRSGYSRRCRRRGRATSRPVPCSTGSARSTGCPRSPTPTRCAARWCTPCSTGCSTCRPPSARPGRPRPWSSPSGRACARSGPTVTDLFGDGLTEEEFVAGARGLLGGYFAVEDPAPPRAGRARDHGRDPCSATSCCCAASSTGSTCRPTRRAAGGRLQDRRRPPRGVRGPGPVPAEVLRPGGLAPARPGPPRAAAASTSRTPRCATTRPTRRS